MALGDEGLALLGSRLCFGCDMLDCIGMVSKYCFSWFGGGLTGPWTWIKKGKK